MAFNVNEFLSDISNRSGPMPTSRFEVAIYPKNNTLLNNITSITEQRFIKFSAFSVNIPGVNMDLDYVMLRGYGRINEIPLRPTMDNCDIGFYLDSDNKMYRFLYAWVNSIINNNGSSSSGDAIAGGYYQEVYYPENFYCDVNITVYGYDKKEIMSVHLVDAYPQELPSIGLNWGTSDSVAATSVSLAFKHIQIFDSTTTRINSLPS